MAITRGALSRRFDAERFRKQLGYTWEFDGSNFQRTIVPTLSSTSFDSAGEKVPPWQIMRLIDSTMFASNFPIETDSKKVNNFVSYLVYQELEIDLSFYAIDSPKYPLWLESKWRYVKNSSRLSETIVRHPSRTRPYASAVYVGVRVHLVTRKPLPFPEEWKSRYRIPTEGRRPEHNFPKRTEQTQTLLTNHRVSYSDVDTNGHANYTFYTRICYDSFAENLFSSQLQSETKTLFENGIKKIQVTFVKECLMGEMVTAESWKDSNSSDTYYFEVKKGEDMCAKATFVFHIQSANEHLHKL